MSKFIIILLLISAGFSSANGQDEAYANKVRMMLELSGASENFNVAVKNMMSIQRESYGTILPEEFFIEIEKEMLGVGMDKLTPKIIPIYQKHLTEEDLDAIIAFYKTEAGQKLISKMPLILNEAIQVGAEWGEEIGLEIYNRIESSNDFLFVKNIDADCSKFREGTFESRIEMIDDVFFVERKDNVQIEKLNGRQIEFEIEWISNNKYVLKGGKDNDNDIPDMEVTIYEVNGEGYKYIAKQSGIFAKGNMKKITRKM